MEIVARRKRFDIKGILADPVLRKKWMVACIISTQAVAGIKITKEQAERAYDKVRNENNNQS